MVFHDFYIESGLNDNERSNKILNTVIHSLIHDRKIKFFFKSLTSQPRAIRPQSQKNREICDICALDFMNCESTCDFTNVPSSI